VPQFNEHKHQARVAETIGLALIALAILALTLVRYGRSFHWSLR
jgi:hypothetical protein